jgi:LPXTG-motif cell wall-anchored protein
VETLSDWLVIGGLFGLLVTGLGFLWIFRHKL